MSEAPRYFHSKCPTCGKQTVNHQTAAGALWCQECETEHPMKPSDMIQGGMRRVMTPPANIAAKIQKAVGAPPAGDQALANFLANRGRTQ